MKKTNSKTKDALRGMALIASMAVIAGFFSTMTVKSAPEASASDVGDYTGMYLEPSGNKFMIIELMEGEDNEAAEARHMRQLREDSLNATSAHLYGTYRKVSAYTSRPEETDSNPCEAADQSDICKRYAAGEKICAANFVPKGSKLYVPGYGTCVVADRMNKRYPDRIDVYMGMDLSAARKFGVKTLKTISL